MHAHPKRGPLYSQSQESIFVISVEAVNNWRKSNQSIMSASVWRLTCGCFPAYARVYIHTPTPKLLTVTTSRVVWMPRIYEERGYLPVIPPSNVDTDMKAFMFIMSIPFISGTWMSRVLVPSDLIETKEGTLFDHAICFAAFLGSLGYNALVLLGVCPDRRKHVSVISLADTNYIWDFHTGEVHTIGDAFLDLNATRKFSKIGTCTIDVYEDLAANDPLEISTILPNNITPYEKILVLFTIDGIWENIQTVPPANTLFDFWDPRLWRPISTGRSAKPNHPPVLYTPSMGLAEIDRVDREFERRICAGVEWVRQSRGMDTRWIGAKEKAHLFKRLELQCECDKSLGHEKSILNSRIREWDRLTCEAIPKGCRCKGKCIRYWMI
eukprot:GHVO01006283.1.p1 GENE.GHVO01006283.1~~GHVO01006283.1.p1  ORF type:complete len:382 (+),score=44.69 GHVO01006283.1:634-1779(+)